MALYYGRETDPSQPQAFPERLNSPNSPGTIVAIGGHADTLVLEQVVMSTSTGRVHVATLANSEPQTSYDYNRAIMTELGATTDHIQDPKQLIAMLERINAGSSVYFGGGDQADLYNKMGNYGRDQLRQAHARGVTIAGSSAGAHILGDVMIRKDKIIDGVGLIHRTVIDTHYSENERQARLRKAVKDRGVVGIGIDEATAAVIKDGELEVVGKGGVHIVHVGGEVDLTKGDRFHLGTRQVLSRAH